MALDRLGLRAFLRIRNRFEGVPLRTQALLEWSSGKRERVRLRHRPILRRGPDGQLLECWRLVGAAARDLQAGSAHALWPSDPLVPVPVLQGAVDDAQRLDERLAHAVVGLCPALYPGLRLGRAAHAHAGAVRGRRLGSGHQGDFFHAGAVHVHGFSVHDGGLQPRQRHTSHHGANGLWVVLPCHLYLHDHACGIRAFQSDHGDVR
mmetsp:Transcript_40316/g.111031  ORF Transcript_40316/g.111031 Transcript_40316/m.111031 type:complete len:206 (-) Transcript_40316:659-1276(-)